MIRLAEAVAKLNNRESILKQDVTEAAYLLKTSIVHIEQEAIDLEEEEQTVMRAHEVGDMDVDTTQTILDEEPAVRNRIFLLLMQFIGTNRKGKVSIVGRRLSKDCSLNHSTNQAPRKDNRCCGNEKIKHCFVANRSFRRKRLG